MRLSIKGYRDHAGKKNPATGVFGSGAWSFLQVDDHY
jgi:hypothetical protein